MCKEIIKLPWRELPRFKRIRSDEWSGMHYKQIIGELQKYNVPIEIITCEDSTCLDDSHYYFGLDYYKIVQRRGKPLRTGEYY